MDKFQYTEYGYQSGAVNEPIYIIKSKADAPIAPLLRLPDYVG
jgi:hypothetical protein